VKFLRPPRFKFFERGFGIRNKIAALTTFIDQRRLDGTRTKTMDRLLKRSRNLLQRLIVEPGKDSGKKFHARDRKRSGKGPHYTLETIEKERAELEKK